MPRVKRGVPARHRHNKIFPLVKGHRASRHIQYRQARESLLHALRYAYFHRRERKGDMRRLWIARISAATRAEGLRYNEFVHALKTAGVEVNRKMLADIAVTDKNAFKNLVDVAQGKS